MQPLDVDEPATVGPYRLLGRLGSGGMGRVYLGRSAGGRTVAVKIVHPHFALDEEFRARFRREVAAARRVGGAWTAPVLDADPDAPVPWVATAYAAGPSLAAAVTDSGPLPAHTVRALGAGLAEALTAVHERGLVHRDVKPSNVLLTLDGPLLIDFGIARAMDGTASLTSTGVSIGSPGYMSPEQILGKGVTGAADVFSLGAVLVHAATGEAPFRGDSSAALLYKVVHEEPELGSLDGVLREVAAACLVKDPAARPAPADVCRRLAPDGAPRLIAGGWLPGALVEQVSRSAVRLLNLDTGETGDSGPVPFDSPSAPEPPGPGGEQGGARGPVPGQGAGRVPGREQASVQAPVPAQASGQEQASAASPAPAQAPVASVAGVFGPAPVMNSAGTPVPPLGPPGQTSSEPATGGDRVPGGAATGVDGVPAGTATGVEGAPAGVPTVVPAPRDASPPGRLSVSVAAASAPAEAGRGRRLSCTVVLAVAGALVTVSLVLGALLAPWFQNDEDAGASSAGPRSPAPSAETGGVPGSGARPGAIPARYLGTWEGQGSELGLPAGTFRITVHQAAVGEELGRLRNTDQLGSVCTDVLTLKRVTKSQLLATSVGAKDNPGHCVADPRQVELTPVGDDLRFTSDSAAEGNAQARMSKVG
ncbi:serine/threonine protein kinase [Streptomyces filipinensis]|uniref:Serine/threonine protein kinase n=1 Tax=Streptomyces filipinensis TaxID=66887 RepID=A0A918IHH5_9ACTN|nr:serine/threonine-protein kinase [Streptomyces filipinensis]GGV17950.1 serine/threonine protein kinase [Streptomyces filipinensis]